MPKLSLPEIKALLSLNIGRDVGKSANVLTNAEIEAAIKARFPGSKITAHDVIPAQPNSKFGPFESTSRVSIEGTPGSLNDRLFGLSQDLKQQAIPGVNHTTGESVLAGPQAADWGGEFSKQHFVQPGDQTAFGNRQEDFKKQFTPDFYHGSPSNKIKAFDASKGDRAFPTEGVTFLTKEPEFAHSFIDVHKNKTSGGWDYDKGSTIYPVSANLGKHFDPATPEGSEAIKQYLRNKYSKEAGTDYFDDAINQKHEHMMDRLTDPVNNWKLLESPGLLEHLKNTGHNSFSVTEGGVKNVGVFNPADIRGKFAEYNPDEAMNPDFMKAEGGAIQAHAPGASRGIAPYGFRHIENTEEVSLPKGSGWLGILPNETGQVSTELSASNDSMSYPMLSPNMSRQEIDSLLANQKPTDEMYSKAEQWAKHRQAQGKSPFISPVGELRYPLPQYAAGGEVLKKVLKFAEDVPFIHYSNHPSLNRLEPSMYGRGIKGQEAARLKDAPDIKDRSYFYVNKGEQTMPPEQGLGSQKYQGTASNVYNAAEDPEGFHAIAKSRALDPYMMSFGREMVDPAVKATELERLIKGAGYEGYHTGDVGLMFHPTPVSKID